MNNLKYFILIYLTTVPTCLFAQKHTDLSAEVIFPEQNGYEVAIGDTLKIMLSVKNLGMEDILPEDTLLYRIEGFPALIYIWDTIPAGDSTIINVLNFINDGSDTANRMYTFCFYLIYDHYQTIEDPNPSNDTTCVRFTAKGNDLGIGNQKSFTPFVNLYPNPAKNCIHLQYDDLQIQSLQLSDLSGRLIKTFPSGNKTLNLRELAAGVYFLQITTKEGDKQTKKIMVNK